MTDQTQEVVDPTQLYAPPTLGGDTKYVPMHALEATKLAQSSGSNRSAEPRANWQSQSLTQQAHQGSLGGNRYA